MTTTSTDASTGLTAWRSYAAAHERLVRHLAREVARETGLSDADFQVLDALVEAPQGRMRSRDLRIALEWEKSRLSHQVRRMVGRGLLDREACTADARAADVVVTAAGRASALRARGVRAASLQRLVLDTLGADRVAALEVDAALLDARLAEAAYDDPQCRAAMAETDDRR